MSCNHDIHFPVDEEHIVSYDRNIHVLCCRTERGYAKSVYVEDENICKLFEKFIDTCSNHTITYTKCKHADGFELNGYSNSAVYERYTFYLWIEDDEIIINADCNINGNYVHHSQIYNHF